MNCPEARGHLAVVLDEPLRTAEELRAHAHLEGCPACARWLDGQVQMVQVLRGLRTVEEAQPPWLVPEHLVKQVLADLRDDGAA